MNDVSPGARSEAIPIAAFAAVCLAATELGQLSVGPTVAGSLAGFWPPAGALIAALVLSDRRRWPVFIATMCGAVVASTALVHGRAFFPSAGIALASGLDACLAASLVRRLVSNDFALDRLPHVVTLVIGAVVAPAVGGLLAANTFLATESSSSMVAVWRAWWLAEAIGTLVTAPLVIAAITARRVPFAGVSFWRALEIAVVFSVEIAVAEGIFGGRVNPLVSVPVYILPFLLWPVLRFGPGGGSAALFLLSLIGLWNASHGQGPIGVLSGANVLLRAQGGLAIGDASLLLLACVVAERKRAAQDHAVLVADLQKALDEIKTLEGFIPICAWCHKVRDDAGFWQHLEEYLDARTDATFSHSICPACIEQEQGKIAAHVQ